MSRIPLKLEDLIKSSSVSSGGENDLTIGDPQPNMYLTPKPRILFSDDNKDQGGSNFYSQNQTESVDTTHLKLYEKTPSPKKFKPYVEEGGTLLPAIVFSNERISFNQFSYNVSLINKELGTSVLTLVRRDGCLRGGTPDVLHTSPTYASMQHHNGTPPFNHPQINSSPLKSEVEIDDAFLTSEVVPDSSEFESLANDDFSLSEYDDSLSEEFIPYRKTRKLKKVKKSPKVKVQKSRKSLVIKISYKTRQTRKANVRSKSGCWTCRIRHKACPEERPECSQCIRLNLLCDYSLMRPEYMTDPGLMTEKLKEIRMVTDATKRTLMCGRRKNVLSNPLGLDNLAEPHPDTTKIT